MEIIHVPVLLEDVLEGLSIRKNGLYVDATLGTGGHSEGVMMKEPECTLIGIEQDEQALTVARQRLGRFSNVHLVRDDFANMANVISELGYKKVSGILLDLGLSTLQIRSGGRGFSFLSDDPLDMRMDIRNELTAEEIVNKYPEKRLAEIIWKYGEEKNSRRIARAIVNARHRKRIHSCRELAVIIEKAVVRRGRIHPATRTFQAIRIEVNRELEKLPVALYTGAELLEKGGRLCVLSYHSLEDRIVKHAFRKLHSEGMFHILTKKPVRPGREEIMQNPSARSAKLRIGEKV